MPQDILTEAKERFQECTDAFSDERTRMREDFEFSNPADPQQWTPEARKAREKAEGGARPCLTVDSTNQFIHQVVNDARQNRPGIDVLPVNSEANIKTAGYLEGMIRQIEYASAADIAYDTSIDHGARAGCGWIRVLTEVVNERLNEQEIRIGSVEDSLSCMISPESVRPDGSDAFDGFVSTIMSKRGFERKYGEKASHTSWDSATSGGWVMADQIRVAEFYKLITKTVNKLEIILPDGSTTTLDEDEYWSLAKRLGFKPQVQLQYTAPEKSVKWYCMTGSDILDETDVPSEWIPLVPVYGNILWIDGKRYVSGMTRQLMDGQRFKNSERSAWLELMQMQPKAPYIVASESIGNHRASWQNSNRSNAAYLMYDALDDNGNALPPPRREQPPMSSPALLQAGQIATDDMQQSMGMYKSNFGAPSNAVSGRAKLQDQREGDTATFHYVDNQRRSIAHVGRIIVGMAPHIYNTAREIRTLNLDGSSKMVKLAQQGPAHQVGRQGQPDIINLTAGAYDVRVKAGPAYSTARQEANDALTDILAKNPAMVPIIGPMWARLQDFPEADKLARILTAMAPKPVQDIENEDATLDPKAQNIVSGLQQQIQQLQQQLQQAQAAADPVQAKLALDKLKIDDDFQVAKFEAETKRLAALNPPNNPTMTPEEIQVMVIDMLHEMSQTQLGNPGTPPLGPDSQFTPPAGAGMGQPQPGMAPGGPPQGAPMGMPPQQASMAPAAPQIPGG
jgi:hypothetical protein